jgi:hypothetical protein
LDAERLTDGRYAELLKSLLDTRRYSRGKKPFQLVTVVDLKDGADPLDVEVEFLAPKDMKLKKNRPQLLPGFRVLRADGSAAAFHAPIEKEIKGLMAGGAENTVRVQIASLSDFLIMKAHALAGRDKPKDAYDICYCLDHYPDGIASLAADWKARRQDKDVKQAIALLREKFENLSSFGPSQVAESYSAGSKEEQDMRRRRAFELVSEFLRQIG